MNRDSSHQPGYSFRSGRALACLLFAVCASPGYVSAADAPAAPPPVEKAPPDLTGVTILDKTSRDDLSQIVQNRGGKSLHERWRVDSEKGKVRIRKERTDGTVLPPGAAVEFWRRDEQGKWTRVPTA